MFLQDVSKQPHPSRRLSPLSLFLQPVDAWLAIGVFVLLSGVLLAAGLGKVLNYAYPALAVLVGIYLFSKHSVLYVGFTWWLWFLSPLVRRLSDHRSSFTDPSPILLAPFLVSLITLMVIFQYAPSFKRPASIIFLAAFLSVLYGYIMGYLNGTLFNTTLKSFEWIAPISFSYYLFVSWRNYPLYRSNMQRVFLWGVLVSGAYGVYQYIVAPEWDGVWLTNTRLLSMGTPEPMGMRVWSTMHGSGVFSSMMMSGLILLVNVRSPLYLPATAAGYLSFLLSGVRSAWVGWLIGMFNLIVSLRSSAKIRLLVIAAITAVAVIPLTQMEQFSDVITTRLETFSDLSSDGSGAGRLSIYQDSFNDAFLNPIGKGIGNTNSFDSGILMIGATLGWIGGVPYIGSLLLLLSQVVQGRQFSHDSFAKASESIVIGMLSQLAFGPNSLGLPGMLLWGFLGMSLAAKQYHISAQSQVDELHSISVV
jgi:hypothetical protein